MSTPESKNGKSSKTTVILAVLVTLGLNAAVYFFWLRHTSAEAAPGHSSSAPVAAVLHLETFTLNIDDPDQRTYLRVGIDLGLDRDLKDSKSNVVSPTAILRDAILNVLMAAKPQDVTTVEGKRKLKEQILAALKERLPELGVREVYFTEFLVQR
ncbi:MAG: flagellar basal body-associated FliL family protein [Acidobacteria bacterium]|nr:flagellar basal body-associated FliL family protein [Acidobacteriota bacterium]